MGGATSTGPSLRTRMALAVLLTVAFYGFALVVGLGLMIGPAAVEVSVGHGNIWLTLVCIGAGFAVLSAARPRRLRFQEPGPAIGEREQPRLHGALDGVGEAAGAPLPDAMFLDLELNAYVADRPRRQGGRVLVLGLPLLTALTPDELRAVVGHELGHYAGGDTRVATWIGRTRQSLFRTVAELEASESGFRSTVVRWPFIGFAHLFERITNAVSRRQEFVADAASARVTGAATAGMTLRRVAAGSTAWDAYWLELAYLLERGTRPPMAGGFANFMGATLVAPRLDEVVSAEIDDAEPDAYASHPTLRERLEALGSDEESPVTALAFEDSAAALLDDLPRLEAELLSARFGDEADRLQDGGWEAVGQALVEDWDAVAFRMRPALDGLTLADAAELVIDPEPHRAAIRRGLGARGDGLGHADVDPYALEVAVALAGRVLHAAGFAVAGDPGEPLVCVRGDERIEPGELLVEARESQDAGEWRTAVAALGLADRPLLEADASSAPDPAAAAPPAPAGDPRSG